MAYQKKGSENVQRIKEIARKAFGSQIKFCEQAGIRNGDFGTKLNLMDSRVDEFNKFLQQFDLKYTLINIDDEK